jgi:hypothetical protein
MTTHELLSAIFPDPAHPLYSDFSDWVTRNRRFKTFAETYQTKIRRKLREAAVSDTHADLHLELSTAFTLLQDRRLEVEYEKEGSKTGGPDFTVTYRANTPFSVEVRRLSLTTLSSEARTRKLIETVCEKVWQMPPGRINVLLLASGAAGTDELAPAMATLRGLAEQKTDRFFERRGFKNSADFINHFRRLSLVVLKSPGPTLFWRHALAKHPVTREIELALQRLLV